ncbi:hypothetical protein HG536_0G01350 [Torulaspora globosa]|uniref:Zn(2)-C6 fungal-type domain-containing protein n=1 Tax=Torulaspora globosa TaxID=48254 RepID=A0A7G3ZL90_9SACH|nr:uncharacterized protein HG536_0G01350 [Torulaspora globosa]QLL34276.1 hypothetical protein HG536_0G01350 [Torulaspora globosa]
MGNRSRSSSNGSVKSELNGQEQPLVAEGSGGSAGGDGSNSPPNSRRRTKASRACDYCRKRKIKCDYSEERGICSSCSRNGEKCSFERVPLKRGPTKGYAKGHNRAQSVSSQQEEADMPSPPSRPASVLLPPLAQYLPQAGGAKTASASATPAANVAGAGTMAQQQQFWKVPYHEFQGQRRGSLDSMQSDLSVGKSLNENLLYTTASGSQNLGSPAVVSNTGGNGGDSNMAYWSFVRSSGSMIGPEEFEEMRRKSGSFPPIFRHSSNASAQQQTPAALYPYSQFTQQQQQQGKPPMNPSISSFGQYGANGFESRQGSIVSENMSPSAPAFYQGVNMALSTSQNQRIIGTSVPQQQQPHRPSPAQSQASTNRAENIDSESPSAGKAPKRRKRSVSERRTRRADSSGSKTSESSSIRPPSCESARTAQRNGIIYGQVSDVDLIDTYYEFIHVGFQIIPLNKKTLTNEILLVNTQPISGIHEINNYVILWFRNSLELLVRISLKKRYNQFFQAPRNDGTYDEKSDANLNSNSSGNNRRDYENDESLEDKSVFISALNECLQKIVDIHPRFRESKAQISSKIKIIYLSTFVLLNYILALVGYDNSFVIGMSVTIFKEFKVYEQLVYEEIEDSAEGEMSIIFKRLYVLLIILDSLQVCCYGGPQLLNFPIQGCTERLFQTGTQESKWDIDDDPIRTKCILQSLKLGELINDLVSNRRSVRDLTGANLIWEPSVQRGIAQQMDQDEPVTIMQIFHDFLFVKNGLTNNLLSLKDLKTNKFQELTIQSCVNLTGLICNLISLTLKILTLIMKLNPNNRIDYNYRPRTPLSNEDSTKDQNTSTETISQSSASLNRNGSDFYQKLLGLQKNNDNGLSEVMKGVISPYCIPILHEIQNTNELIKQIPTLLIGVVMTISNKTPLAGQGDFAKPQELVVELSNSMNEVVQITSLLNMIKPLRLLGQDPGTDSSWRYLTGNAGYDKSIIERLYESRNRRPEGQPTPEDSLINPEQLQILKTLNKVGWKLLDDKELGWF